MIDAVSRHTVRYFHVCNCVIEHVTESHFKLTKANHKTLSLQANCQSIMGSFWSNFTLCESLHYWLTTGICEDLQVTLPHVTATQYENNRHVCVYDLASVII